jgi:hypothetical protein
VLDVLVHGLVAIIVTFPLVAVYQDTKSTILLFVTIYLTATLIDLDHFAAAGSLDFSDALNLHVRPMTHSLTFAFMVGGVSYLLLRNPIISLALFLALASHVIRDAAGGPTPILWPLPFQSVPWWVYYAGEVLILCLSYLVMTKARLD